MHLESFRKSTAILIIALGGLSHSASAAQPQPVILTTATASRSIVIFPDPGNAPASQKLVTGVPADASPQGVDYFDSDHALVADNGKSRIFVVKLSTAAVIDTISTAGTGYNGDGTLAVAPDFRTALASANTASLKVIAPPFDAAAKITSVALPGTIRNYQTQAIVFDNAGRAFVHHSEGISVLDPPYTSVAFTIARTNFAGGAIAISPDGQTVLTTDFETGSVRIYQAPFSAATTSVILPGGGSRLNGIKVTPDGSKAIVVSGGMRYAASISAPFSSSSRVEPLPLPPSESTVGFEDVGISADGQLAMLAGRSSSPADVPVLVRAPFTTAEAVSSDVPVQNVENPARGGGAVRFLPPGLAPAPQGQLLNISTRLSVSTGENALIGGFIITGNEPKKVIIRAIGPSLAARGVKDALQDPTVELFDGAGALLMSNDDWKEAQQPEIEASTIPPSRDEESAIVATLAPGGYTAVVRGRNDSSGIGLVEVYDLAQGAPSTLANISSRGFVETGENVMIGGFIVGGSGTRVVIRAIGPSLSGAGVSGALQDPTLQLVDANGAQVQANDNWKSDQQAEIEAIGIQPADDRESTLVALVGAGNYTAVVRGKDATTGVGLVEVYNLQ